MVIWLIGLSGAGKTTIGRKVYKILRERDSATVFLDGDHFREIMGEDLGHSLEDREKNGWRMCKMSSWLDQQRIDVVACVLSNFPDQQNWNRTHMQSYFEVYVEVPMAVLEARDQKGLYSGAKEGRLKNVVGVDLPFLPPVNPDLVIRNDEDGGDTDSLAEQIVSSIALQAN